MDHASNSAHYFFPSAPEYLSPNMYLPQPDSQVYHHHVAETRLGPPYFHAHTHGHAAHSHPHSGPALGPVSHSLAHSGHMHDRAGHTHSHTDGHTGHTPPPSSHTQGHPSHAHIHVGHTHTPSGYTHTSSGHTHTPSGQTHPASGYTQVHPSHTHSNSSLISFRTHGHMAMSSETEEIRVTPTPQVVEDPVSATRTEEEMDEENFTPWRRSQRQQSVSMAGDVFDQWCRIGIVEGLQTDTDIARFLIKQYETTQNGVQPSAQCLKCRAALPLFCKKCQAHATHSNVPNVPSPRASASAFDIRFLLNEDSDSQLSSKTEQGDVDPFSPSTQLSEEQGRAYEVIRPQKTGHGDVNTHSPFSQCDGKRVGDKHTNEPLKTDKQSVDTVDPSNQNRREQVDVKWVDPLMLTPPSTQLRGGQCEHKRANEPQTAEQGDVCPFSPSSPSTQSSGGRTGAKWACEPFGGRRGPGDDKQSNSAKERSSDTVGFDGKHNAGLLDGSGFEVDVTEHDDDDTVDDFDNESMDIGKFTQTSDENLDVVDKQPSDEKMDVENLSHASDKQQLSVNRQASDKTQCCVEKQASGEELYATNKQVSDLKQHSVKTNSSETCLHGLSKQAADENYSSANRQASDKNVCTKNSGFSDESPYSLNKAASDENVSSLNRDTDKNLHDVDETVHDVEDEQESLSLHDLKRVASEEDQLEQEFCEKKHQLKTRESENVGFNTDASNENLFHGLKKTLAVILKREEGFPVAKRDSLSADAPMNGKKSAKCRFKLACEQASLKRLSAEKCVSPVSKEHENCTKHSKSHSAGADMRKSSPPNADSVTVPKQLEPKSFTCEQCQKIFKTASSLRRHEKVHSADKPFKCRFCPASFHWSSGLDTHMKSHCREKLNKCQVCEKTFRTSVSLRLHVERHQHEARENSETKQSELVDAERSTDLADPPSPIVLSRRGSDGDCRAEHAKVELSPRAHSTRRSERHSDAKRVTVDAGDTDEESSPRACSRKGNGGQSSAKCVNAFITGLPSTSKRGQNSRAKCVKGDSTDEKKAAVAKYHCLYCEETFTNLRRLTKHVATHAEKIVIQCKFCLKVFNNAEALRTHIQIQHSKGGKQRYKCAECGACFTTRSRLTSHGRTHSGERPFVCEACGASFALQHTLLLHQRTHTGDKPYQCTDCDKSFTWKRSLHYHRSKHSKTFASLCHLCGAWFRTPEHLADHLRRHANTREFSCQICGKAFKTKSDLYSHNTHVHSECKSFKCSECGYAFSTKSALKKHSRKHSGEKPYKCAQCSKSFSYFSSLSAHRKLHEDKQFSCNVCGASFVMQWGLNTHMRKHTGQKPYKCKLCNEAFAWHSGLKNHMRKHAE